MQLAAAGARSPPSPLALLDAFLVLVLFMLFLLFVLFLLFGMLFASSLLYGGGHDD